MRRKLSRIGRLTWRERFLVAQALFLLPVVAMALRLMGLSGVQRVLARLSRRPEPVELDDARLGAARLRAWAVAAAARHGPFHSSCLPQSLVLWWLVRRLGIAADARIGVRKRHALLEAHAWVEIDGMVLSAATDAGGPFSPFEQPVAPRLVGPR